ncbi:MAG: NAD(P)H-hydrate dehydratase, partial [Gammaproteobacteria bacterium]
MTAAWPTELYSAAGVRALDTTAIEQFSIPALTLMQRAGAAAYAVLRERWPDARHICVVCGRGNNAGDGFVLARLAHADGLTVQVLAIDTDPDKPEFTGAAQAARDAMLTAGVHIDRWPAADFKSADVLVDALFGTGLNRAPAGIWHTAIEAMNNAAVPVLALDIPSGLQADNGSVPGIAVAAAVTVSFIGLKTGLFTGCGRDYCGEIVFAGLDVPAGVYTDVPPTARRIDYNQYRQGLGSRQRSAHKGRFGHVLVVGGDFGYNGAVRLAAEAAGRCGAGLVSIATRSSYAHTIAAVRPELMGHAVETPSALEPLLEQASVVAVGPGLGQTAWGESLWQAVMDTTLPLVVDADGLNWLAQNPCRRDNWILTPHPGEAARLLGQDTASIQADRFAAVQALQQRYGGSIVLKGSGTLIASAAGSIALCSDGNPGMATGGMGDVLSG